MTITIRPVSTRESIGLSETNTIGYYRAVDALTGKGAPVERATVICNTFCIASSLVLVPRHRREVCPLARRVILPESGATRIHPITGWRSLFPTPLPAPPSVGLAASLPRMEEQYELTTFRKVDTDG